MLANFSERWEKFEDTQRGNQKFSIEEGQTMWWPKENRTKGQTMINKTLNRKLKVWATRTPLKSADLFIQQLRFDLCFYDVMIEVYNSSDGVVLLVFHFITIVPFVIL